jgi:hypothetical protein
MSTIEPVASTEQMQDCIQQCLTCQRVCLETLAYCLDKAGPHAETAHIRLLLDCADICQTSANFMMRGSELHILTCEVCADICAECADDCESFEGDPRMRECERMCRACADSCQALAEEMAVE